VFVSHPLANGDVGWEALVSDRELQVRLYHMSLCLLSLCCRWFVCDWGGGASMLDRELQVLGCYR
jgi:hypothetical protein